eukprot:m.10130 g.10130  ORF g.10130 m.10130 type:complete len:371 (+) comp7225_c0_seq1:258-1370(+)
MYCFGTPVSMGFFLTAIYFQCLCLCASPRVIRSSKTKVTTLTHKTDIKLPERGVFFSCAYLPAQKKLACVYRKDAISYHCVDCEQDGGVNSPVQRTSQGQLDDSSQDWINLLILDPQTLTPVSETTMRIATAQDPRLIVLNRRLFVMDNNYQHANLKELDISDLTSVKEAANFISLKNLGKNLIPLQLDMSSSSTGPNTSNADIYVLDIEQSILLTMQYLNGSYTKTHVRRLFRDNIHQLPGKLRGGTNSFVQNGLVCGFGHSTIEPTDEDRIETAALGIEVGLRHFPIKWCLDESLRVLTISRVDGPEQGLFKSLLTDPCSVWTYKNTTYVSTAESDFGWASLMKSMQKYYTRIYSMNEAVDSIALYDL